jgi:hypothetical protein
MTNEERLQALMRKPFAEWTDSECGSYITFASIFNYNNKNFPFYNFPAPKVIHRITGSEAIGDKVDQRIARLNLAYVFLRKYGRDFVGYGLENSDLVYVINVRHWVSALHHLASMEA